LRNYILKPTHQIKRFLICFVCIFTCITLTFPYLSYADTQDDYDANNAKLEELRRQQSELSSDLTSINGQLQEVGERIANLEEQMGSVQSDITSLEEELTAISADMDSRYASMKLRIQYMYERSSSNIIDLLLSSQSIGELLVKGEYFQQISQYDRDMLEDMEQVYSRQQTAMQELETQLNELNSLSAEANTQKANLNELLEKTQQAFDSSSSQISEAEQLALQYEEQLEQERIAREQAEIEAARLAAQTASASQTAASTPVVYDASDLAMLAAIIECEAGNQSYEGKLAVGSVVVNRVNSPNFANTISGVIYASGQFTPVASGRFTIVLARGADSSCVQAAQEVLNGHVTINALYFHVYRSGIDVGGTIIGDHVFY
jgi:peptidoglycan hydrolase CwlO-like protein